MAVACPMVIRRAESIAKTRFVALSFGVLIWASVSDFTLSLPSVAWYEQSWFLTKLGIITQWSLFLCNHVEVGNGFGAILPRKLPGALSSDLNAKR